MVTLAEVKKGLNITGDYNDNAIQFWMDAVVEFLRGAGVSEARITPGLVARGVDDLWRYGGGESVKFSKAFEMMAAQAALRGGKS